jgi:hypothetical protein
MANDNENTDVHKAPDLETTVYTKESLLASGGGIEFLETRGIPIKESKEPGPKK